MRLPIITFSKTSQGPAKSITTAPSEMRNATGMLPSAGGLSGLETAAAPETFFAPDCCAGAAGSEKGRAAAKLAAPEARSNSLRVNLLLVISWSSWDYQIWRCIDSIESHYIVRRYR